MQQMNEMIGEGRGSNILVYLTETDLKASNHGAQTQSEESPCEIYSWKICHGDRFLYKNFNFLLIFIIS
jgi:hypothetical protein